VKRETLRMQAAAIFVESAAPPEIARVLRVSVRSVYRWSSVFAGSGTAALASGVSNLICTGSGGASMYT
jgi:hypothetical protein